MSSEKQWWIPLWKGLVVDPEAKHYHRMKNSLWLYLYLLISADRSTGFLRRKIRTVSQDTGIKERTIRQWLSVLKKQEYIQTKANGRCLSIQIKKWKRFKDSGWHDSAYQSDTALPTRVAKICKSEEDKKSQKSFCLSQKSEIGFEPIDITIVKEIFNIDNDNKNSFKDFKPKTREELLAKDLAITLNDLQALPLYLSYSKKYPESLLRKILGEVKEIPQDKIKKSRGALFNHLIKKYAEETIHNSRN